MKKKKTFLLLFVVTMLFIGYNKVIAFSNYSKGTKSCGNGYIDNIPNMLPRIIHIVYLLLQIAVPIILVILGMIDLIKAITAGKEDDIRKNQGVLIRRLIIGALVFFVFSIVKVVVYIVADNNNHANNIIQCVDCFLNNNGSCK